MIIPYSHSPRVKRVARKNEKTGEYNGIYDRYCNPVLTREHIPLYWKYDLDINTNPNFLERHLAHITTLF